VSELGQDYFQFDNIKHQMLGERTGQRFRLGDRVHVRLVRANLESNKIDFVLVQEEGKGQGTGKPGRVTKTVARVPVKVAAKVPSKTLAKPKVASKPRSAKAAKAARPAHKASEKKPQKRR
jgi:ribonuclease R